MKNHLHFRPTSPHRSQFLVWGVLVALCFALLPMGRALAGADATAGVTPNIPDEVAAGEDFVITFTYVNDDPYSYTNVTMIDKVPAGASYVSGGSYNANTQEITISGGPVDVSGTVVFSYTLQVPESFTGTSITVQDVAFRLEESGYEPFLQRVTFAKQVTVVRRQAATPTPTPTGTPSPTPTPSGEPKPVIRIQHPSVVSPGEQITYTFQLKNEGTGAVPEIIDLETMVPTNTTYVSGGTESGGKVTYPNVTNLGPGETKTFTLVVAVPGDAAVDSTIQAPTLTAWRNVGGGQLQSIGYYPPGATTVVAKGTLLAIYRNKDGVAFDPAVFGYGYQNYGKYAGAADDLGPADAFDLFGPSACKNAGATRDNCQLSAAGTQWINTQLSSMNGGHCEGMAVTAQRFFEALPFHGMTSPSDFQPGRTNVYDLVFPDQKVANYTASYFVRQIFDEVALEAVASRDLGPAGIVDKLITDFNKTPSVGYVLGVYKPGYVAGHAITPYGVERVDGTNIYRILVYDNNFPGEKRYVTVNKDTNEWTYVAAADPTEQASLYKGDASTKTLEINPLSLRDKPAGKYFPCPFCGNSGQVGASATTTNTISVEFTGEGKILIVDENNHKVGYDFDTETEVNEISGADSTSLKHGLGLELPPIYEVPYPQTDVLYQVYVGGRTADSLTSGDLTVTGPDFVLGVDYITLGAGELYRFDISPDGNEIFFEATQDTIAPALFMAFDPANDQDPGLIVEIDGMLLKQGEVAYIAVAPDEERVYFVATPDSIPVVDRTFTVIVTDIWPDGEENTRDYTVTVPKGANSAYLDYSGLSSSGGEAKLVVEFRSYLPTLQR